MDASAITCPNGSATKDEPQNSRPVFAAGPFIAHAIHRGDVNAVGDGVRALDGAPGVELRRAVLLLFAGMPADRRGIEQNVRAAQRRDARGFRIPLIPAHQHADASEGRVEIRKSEIARSEIKLFEIERIVGDVHLAIQPRDFAVGVENRGRVVIEARGAPLKQRRDDDDLQLARQLAQRLGGRAGNRLGQIEQLGVLLAAEILRAEQFLQADDLRPARGGLADSPLGLGQILVGIGRRSSSAPGRSSEFFGI